MGGFGGRVNAEDEANGNGDGEGNADDIEVDIGSEWRNCGN